MTYKFNVLKFWINIWCLFHLCDCSWHNVDDPTYFFHNPTKFKIKISHWIQRLKLHALDMIFFYSFSKPNIILYLAKCSFDVSSIYNYKTSLYKNAFFVHLCTILVSSS